MITGEFLREHWLLAEQLCKIIRPETLFTISEPLNENPRGILKLLNMRNNKFIVFEGDCIVKTNFPFDGEYSLIDTYHWFDFHHGPESDKKVFSNMIKAWESLDDSKDAPSEDYDIVSYLFYLIGGKRVIKSTIVDSNLRIENTKTDAYIEIDNNCVIINFNTHNGELLDHAIDKMWNPSQRFLKQLVDVFV